MAGEREHAKRAKRENSAYRIGRVFIISIDGSFSGDNGGDPANRRSDRKTATHARLIPPIFITSPKTNVTSSNTIPVFSQNS